MRSRLANHRHGEQRVAAGIDVGSCFGVSTTNTGSYAHPNPGVVPGIFVNSVYSSCRNVWRIPTASIQNYSVLSPRLVPTRKNALP